MVFTDAHSHFSSQKALTIVQSDDKASLRSEGVHPVLDADRAEEKLQLIEHLAEKKQLVAIGECGLDKSSTLSTDEQIDVFKKQIAIAGRYALPVIVHCVARWSELELIVREFPTQTFILHGFRKLNVASKLMQENTFFSFGQALLYDQHLQQGISDFPHEKILLETDDKQFDIQESYERLSGILSLDLQSVTGLIEANFHRAFPFVQRKEAGK